MSGRARVRALEGHDRGARSRMGRVLCLVREGERRQLPEFAREAASERGGVQIPEARGVLGRTTDGLAGGRRRGMMADGGRRRRADRPLRLSQETEPRELPELARE